MTDEQLIALLANEDVPVIAIALAQLEPGKRMAILERMEPEEKGKTLIELGSLQDIPLEAIVEVAAKLKEKASYLPKPIEFSRGGAKEIADLIGEMDADEGERYMQTLQNENPELYKDVKIYTNSLALQIVWEANVSTLRKQTTKSPRTQRNAKSVKRKKPLGLHCECV